VPGPWTPSDSVVGPIVAAIASRVATQIPAVGHVYEELPDRSPTDNEVVVPLLRGRHGVQPNQNRGGGDTSGKFEITYTFSLRHVFRRREIDQNLKTAYTYIQPWLNFFSALPNQSLGGLTRTLNVTNLTITQASMAGQPMVVLAVEFDALTEFNISYT